jgi:hypothetical protein
MDALRRDAAILRGLLLGGPGITIALALIAFTAFMLSVLPDEKGLDAILACLLFSIVCLLARAASRVPMYCESAGLLGLPRHALAMRRAQCILIGFFTLPPIAYALWSGAGFRAVVIFVGGAAIGIYLAEALTLVVIAAFALKGVAATGVDISALLFGAPGSAVILAASAWGIARWLQLPKRLEAAAAAASLTFSDSAHEGTDVEGLDAANEAFEHHLGDVVSPRAPQVLTPRRLWIGLSYDPRGNWRTNATGLLFVLAVAVICHFWKHARWDLGVYLAVSGIFAIFVFGRFQQMNEAWLRTPGEQSLLVLSTRWPTRAAFRLVLLRSVWTGVPELLAGWLLFSAADLAFGWIEYQSVTLAAFGLLATLVSSLGIFLSYFSYSRVRRTNVLPMAYLLIALAGIATLLTSIAHAHIPGTLIGAALLLGPAAVAFLAFFLRPTLFPVQIDVRR